MAASTSESPRKKAIGTAILVVAAIAAAWIVISSIKPPDADPAGPEGFIREITKMLEEGKGREARERIDAALKEHPEHAGLHLVMGTCLLKMSFFESAAKHLQKAAELDPEPSEKRRVQLGHAYLGMAYAARALPFLEERCRDSVIEEMRQGLLVECYISLERYADALKILEKKEIAGDFAWARHRALRYLGRTEEAERLLEAADPRTSARLRAVHEREQGNFQKALEEIIRWDEKDPAWILQFRSTEMAIYLEAGRLDPLLQLSRDLTIVAKPSIAGRAIWYHALANLLAGRRDEAVKWARIFLKGMNPEYTPLRLEWFMMRHLAGEMGDKEIAEEAGKVSRFHANDLYYYLSLATGDKAWAKKALESTPGRNFPYHAIKRQLGT